MTKFKILNSDSSDKKIEEFIAKEIVKIYKEYVKYRKSKHNVYLNMHFSTDYDGKTVLSFNNSYWERYTIDNTKKVDCFGVIEDE